MKRLSIFTLSFLALAGLAFAQATPGWVADLEKAFPSRDWVAVSASGTNQNIAENSAMNGLARAFKTDVASLSQASQQFTQLVSEAAGKKTVAFDQSQNFAQEVNTSTNVRGLIGVQTDLFRAKDGTVYVNARMKRDECAARYSGMIRENEVIINQLLNLANPLPVGFEKYAALSFAHGIAQVTDNFQNILEVLDPRASSRKPGYGGANAIKVRMQACANGITVGIAVSTEVRQETTRIARAFTSFFKDRGFKTNEQGSGLYILRADVSFQDTPFERVQSTRYYFDASLEDRKGNSVFGFTEEERKSHLMAREARILALGAVEASIKEAAFAKEFDAWLGSLVD
ncbi:MAG: hypothetical protein LBT39_00990 [Treponema sp.]|jgi:hypothetical protein|nr:hypothetical protein [Treponema sp.]